MSHIKPKAFITSGPIGNFIVVSVDRKGRVTETACHNLATAKHEVKRLNKS